MLTLYKMLRAGKEASANAKRCECCNDELKSTQTLKCAIVNCHREYKHTCVGYTDQTFKKLSSNARKEWVCPACKCSARKLGDNTNTPLGTPDNDNVCLTKRQRGRNACTMPQQNLANEDEEPRSSELPSWYGSLETSLITKMRSLIKSEVEEFKRLSEQVLESVRFMSDRYDEMHNQLTACNEEIVVLKKENCELKTSMVELSSRLTLLEQNSRECNLEITCLPEYKGESLQATVAQLASVVSFPLPTTDIFACKRVAKLKPDNERPRAVIVKLRSASKRRVLSSGDKIQQRQARQSRKIKHQ